MRFAGIDIGAEQHVIAVVDDTGATIVKPTTFAENAGGYERARSVLGDPKATDVAEGSRPDAAGGTAVICNPPSFGTVIQIAAHGERVPRKSTSFGPKPRTGLVLRTFGPAQLSPAS